MPPLYKKDGSSIKQLSNLDILKSAMNEQEAESDLATSYIFITAYYIAKKGLSSSEYIEFTVPECLKRKAGLVL